MHLLRKTVAGRFYYYFNELKYTWEGLIDNATEIKGSQLDYWKVKLINPVSKFQNCEIVKI